MIKSQLIYIINEELQKLFEWEETDTHDDIIYSLYEQRDEVLRETIRDFMEKPLGTYQPWRLIPFIKLKKLFEDALKFGFIRDEKLLDDIEYRLIRNLLKLDVNTELCGHMSSFPEDDITDLGYTMEKFNEKNNNSNDVYFEDPKSGQWRISDYGLKPLWNIGEKLIREKDDKRKLSLISQFLDVVHQRSDMASWFVEGGSSSLNKISGMERENKNIIKNEINEIENKKITYTDELTGFYAGQKNMETGIYVNDEIVGLVQYHLYGSELTIANIFVREEFRRQGFGSRLIKHIMLQNPDYKYKPSLMTDLGSKFKHKDVSSTEKENINEIGEANIKPYPYIKTDEKNHGDEIIFTYKFIAKDQLEYLVFLVLKNKKEDQKYYLDVGYGVKNKYDNYDYINPTNQGDVYKIMSTVIAIIKEVVINDLKYNGIEVDYLTFSPTKNNPEDKRRLKLNLAYLKRLKPNWQYETRTDPYDTSVDIIKIKMN